MYYTHSYKSGKSGKYQRCILYATSFFTFFLVWTTLPSPSPATALYCFACKASGSLNWMRPLPLCPDATRRPMSPPPLLSIHPLSEWHPRLVPNRYLRLPARPARPCVHCVHLSRFITLCPERASSQKDGWHECSPIFHETQ